MDVFCPCVDALLVCPLESMVERKQKQVLVGSADHTEWVWIVDVWSLRIAFYHIDFESDRSTIAAEPSRSRVSGVFRPWTWLGLDAVLGPISSWSQSFVLVWH